ncbi:hypothetical protein EYF80_056446 [Liparis tanakae]|uniref:Uncharacterized protein n=1 Tax=Liparis tanakae TaxID=230148 RepID=A0A4Z2EYU1_9TELE|nr:hypothetical protein EYF80_056446 [Liparis tanakae]
MASDREGTQLVWILSGTLQCLSHRPLLCEAPSQTERGLGGGRQEDNGVGNQRGKETARFILLAEAAQPLTPPSSTQSSTPSLTPSPTPSPTSQPLTRALPLPDCGCSSGNEQAD